MSGFAARSRTARLPIPGWPSGIVERDGHSIRATAEKIVGRIINGLARVAGLDLVSRTAIFERCASRDGEIAASGLPTARTPNV